MVGLLLVTVAYLCGSLPTGVWVAGWAGIDVRQRGSGNIGATNVARTVGARPAILTLIGDVLKGLLPVLVARTLAVGPWILATVALAAFVGHIYSVFLRFSGGKGVATALGVLLGLAPWLAAACVIVFALVAWRSHYVSLASIVAAASLPLCSLVLRYPLATSFAGLLMGAGIILRHRENLRRLWRREESRFSVRTR